MISDIYKSADKKRLEGMVALITGASSGIGAAVAKAYADEGVKVVVNYSSNENGAHETAESIEQSGGISTVIKADVSRINEVCAMIEKIHKTFGTVDILVNNAAILPRNFWESNSEEQWDLMMAVNLKGHYNCTKAVQDDMTQKKYGKIINVSSVVFVEGYEAVDYTSTKAAIVGFTRSMAGILGPYNICVNCILPGLVLKTHDPALNDMSKLTEEHKEIIKRQILKTVGRPDYVTGAFIFLASHESDYITGSCLAVDGGYTRY